MKLVAVIAASLLTVAAFAQSPAVETETASAGLLGKRYLGAGFAWTDIKDSSIEGLDAGLVVNVPVNANVDLTASYGYSWVEGVIGVGHTASVAATAYTTKGENKYYGSLSTGYAWVENRFDKDHMVWGAEVGIERAVNDKVATSFSVGYDDDFGQHRESYWNVAIGASYNVTSKIVATAEVALIEGGSVSYLSGVAYRF